MIQSMAETLPILIQGGMGVAVSNWRLAHAVASLGQLGVVSGTALDTVLVRRLQLGDPGGHMRRALTEFPYPRMAQAVLDRYFIEGGKPADQRFAATHVLDVEPDRPSLELVVVANFVEVYLAKEGHAGPVGVNYLEKIQPPTLPSLFGAMLAGVDYVLMGAGIPRQIPGILDRLVDGLAVELPLNVEGGGADKPVVCRFDPGEFSGGDIPWLDRPRFLPIVASATLASVLSKKSNGQIDGFVIEGPTAGGHNAPPRRAQERNARGEPVYGPRDAIDLEVFRQLGLPFWLAGAYGSPERLAEARRAGAAGIQVGTAFAFCQESGLTDTIKESVIQMCRAGTVDVRTDPLASPTGFPFKVLQMHGTQADSDVYDARQRVCDLGFLRQAYYRPDGSLGWRCPGEPEKAYLRKGGTSEDTVGRKCLCNGLMADVGLAQICKDGCEERPLVTCGDDVTQLLRFLPEPNASSYSARDVVHALLATADDVSLPCVADEVSLPTRSGRRESSDA